MSTKAEIKRKKELKKKINLISKIVLILACAVLGVIYGNMGGDGGQEAYEDTFSLKQDTGKNIEEPVNDTAKIQVQDKSAKDTTLGDSSSTDPAENIDKNEVADTENSDIIVEEEIKDPDTLKSHYDTDGRLNINRATQDELCRLNGIGEKRAADIIEYRVNNGGFKTIEDIMKVKGIKQGVFSKIKDYITCEP